MTNSAAKDAPAFDFYAERWSHGTRHMSKIERSDYLDLLVFQWTELAIPSDLQAVARVLGYKRPEQIPEAVLDKFPLCADGKRRNPRLETIRTEQRERIRKKSEQRKAAAHSRWKGKRSDNTSTAGEPSDQQSCDRMPAASPDPCEPDTAASSPHVADHSAALRTQCPPPTTHHPPQIPTESPPLVPRGDEPVVGSPDQETRQPIPGSSDAGSRQTGYAAGFEEFWQAYPHKVGKGGAWRVWRRIRDRPPNEQLLAALEGQKASTQWRRDHGRYIPHPATWLNQRRWEDTGRQEETAAAKDAIRF